MISAVKPDEPASNFNNRYNGSQLYQQASVSVVEKMSQ